MKTSKDKVIYILEMYEDDYSADQAAKKIAELYKKLFKKMFKEIKHGSKEHEDWLRRKINDFVKKNV